MRNDKALKAMMKSAGLNAAKVSVKLGAFPQSVRTSMKSNIHLGTLASISEICGYRVALVPEKRTEAARKADAIFIDEVVGQSKEGSSSMWAHGNPADPE